MTIFISHPYEDRDLVLEMMKQEALEEVEDMNTQANPFVPAGFEGLIADLALKAQAEKPQRKKRVLLLSNAMKAVEQGLLPEPVEITSEANLTYNTHMAKLYGYAKAGLRTAVEDYPLSGTNTYARAVKGYRDLLIKYLDMKAAEQSKVAKAQPKTPAKKISAAPKTKQATSAAKAATPAKSKTTAAKARTAPAKKK